MYKILCLLTFMFLGFTLTAQIWMSKNAQIRFFSTTPIEDIEALNNYAAGAINAKTGRIFFKAMMKSFKFEKALMQEHFNENYVESDQYPTAEFDGIIQNLPDLSQDGSHEVIVKGQLSLHGTKFSREIKASLTIKNGKIETKAIFLVACHEHNIKIPSVTRKNISDQIEVTIKASFIPKPI